MSNKNPSNDKKNTPKDDTAQQDIVKKPLKKLNKPQDIENIVQLKDRGTVDYDLPEVQDFVKTVFHTMDDTDNILTWTPKSNTPSFPKSLSKTEKILKNTNMPRAFYFGTSTVHVAEDGKLYNRKSEFSKLHVVVLDDIGTKVDADSLPEDLAPNYIIETSEGNFQYGYILQEPIETLELAEALIHLVYTSGYSDGGGKMPTKVVRLPCGINGKKGDKGDFRVRLVELNDEYWTPEELLDVMDVGVDWDDVKRDATAARRGRSAMMSGTSQWSPIQATAGSLNGVVDQMLEWLYDNDLVSNDNGDWVTIQCPWHDEHSDNADTAGYSPVGRGGQFSNMRSFHCFHDHCKDRKGQDFLEWAITNGAPRVPLVDNVADLIADYAYVAENDSAYRIRGVNKPTGIKIGAFRNTFPKKVPVYDVDGKIKMTNEHALWLTAPNRLTLQGTISDPSTPERITEHDGQRYLNLYAPPSWGSGLYDQAHIDRFNAFLEYLIPKPEERDYFMQWLAAKAQNPTFKGAAILMVAPAYGTGRTTLTDMMATLFTAENVKKVTFNQLCGASAAGAYNDWQESLLVTCDEIMSDTVNKHSVYENMKELFDPRPKTVLINTKYGAQRHSTVYTSYLLLTNHVDAIGHLDGDRRVYAISNARVPESPEYFTSLNEWLNEINEKGKPAWAESVWRYLQTLTPDITMLNAPAPNTAAKDTMVDETKSVCDLLAEEMIEMFGGITPNALIATTARDVLERMGDPDSGARARVVETIIKKNTSHTQSSRRLNGTKTRLRICRKEHARLFDSEVEAFVASKLDALKELYDNEHDLINALADKVDERK